MSRPVEDRHRTWSLPEDVVYVFGVVYLAASAVVGTARRGVLAVRWFIVDVAWPGLRHAWIEATWQVVGITRRWARAAPAWLTGRRTVACLWATSLEVLSRRGLVAIGQSTRAGAARIRSSPVARKSARLTVRSAIVAAVAVIGLIVGSGPVLTGIAHVVIGDLGQEDLPHLAQTSEVVGVDGRTVGFVEQERRRLIDAATLPEHVEELVLAAEDHRFEDHDGYDLEGLGRAALANVRAGEVEQGGSTITQQLAKLNFTGDDPSLGRKAEELLYAVRLEDELSKEQLLERYLNQVYFGNGAHGIAAATEEYFATTPDRLTVSQSALLAGIIRSPNALDPRRAPAEARHRRDAVLERAADEGLISQDDAATAIAEPLELAPPEPRPPRDPVLDAVRSEVQQLPALGSTPEERLERFETGGLRVETTLDPALQDAVQAAIDTSVDRDHGITAAVAAVDPTTGAVRALRSGGGTAGGFDLAREGRRQPGSTFKPLTAVAALEQGLAPGQPLVGNGPVEFDYGGPETWRVDNFEGTDAGTVDLSTALRKSVNTSFAQLGVAVGPDAIADVVDRVGIDTTAALGTREQRGPSLALGGIARGVSPLELAGAYAVLANDGRRAEPYLVERIRDPDGAVMFERSPRTEQVIDQSIAGQVRAMLEEAVSDGTGQAARIDGVPIFGKTGTSQDAADAWFVGSTSNLTAAVWIGHPEARRPMPQATGGSVAAPIWRQIVETWTARHAPHAWPEASTPSDAGVPLPLPQPVPAP